MIKGAILRNKKTLIILLLIGVVFILLYFSILYPAIRPQSFHNANHFLIGIRVDGHIWDTSNATFLLPLPVYNGTPHLGTKPLTGEIFLKEGYSISLVEEQEGAYVKVFIPSQIQNSKDIYVVYDDYFEVPASDSGFHPTNTRDPIGHEPVFLPKNNLTLQKPATDSSLAWYGFRYNPLITRYQIPVYAEYAATNDTTVEIYGWVKGVNQWSELGTYLSNSYQDNYRLFLNGSSDGWYLADGEMESGEGKYLDT